MTNEKKYRLEQNQLIVKADNIEEMKQIIENEYYTCDNMKVEALKNMVGKDDYMRCNLRWYSHNIYFSNRNFNKKGKKLDIKAYLIKEIDEKYKEEMNKKIETEKENEKREQEFQKNQKIETEKRKKEIEELKQKILNCNIEVGEFFNLPIGEDITPLMNEKYLHVGTYRSNAKKDNKDVIIYKIWDEQHHYIPKPINEKKYVLMVTETHTELKRKTHLLKEAKIYEENELIKTICLVDLYLNYKSKSKSESEYHYYDNLNELYEDNDYLNLPKIAEWYKKKDWRKPKESKKITPKKNELYIDARGIENNRWEGKYQTDNDAQIYDVFAQSSNIAELEALLTALKKNSNTKIKFDIKMDNEWVINGLNGASYCNNWTQFNEILSHDNFGTITKTNRNIIERIWN